LTWVDRMGNEEPVGFEPRIFAYPRLSPDGSRIAFATREETADVWVGNLTRLSLTRLTENGEDGLSPVWSPDGTRIIYGTARALFWRRSDGSTAAEQLVDFGEDMLPEDRYYPRSISPDGRTLFTSSAEPPRDIGVMRLGVDVGAEPLIATQGEQVGPELSPDGHWLTYDSNESGRFEVYVRPYPNIGDSRVQVSTNGGMDPVFSRDGTELFYWVDPGTIMSVTVRTGQNGEFVADLPRTAASGEYIKGNVARQYDVSSDGERFVVLKRADAAAAAANDSDRARLVIVQNWFAELERLIPTD
jgi:Tol biopolymer transport system component